MTPARVRTFAVAGLLSLAGCSEVFSPPDLQVEDGRLTIIRVDPDAPPLDQLEVHLWAVEGERSEAQIVYLYPNGTTGKCLRFVVPEDALLRHPGGRAAVPGDSVRITIRVVDPTLYLFEFDPGGLTFDPERPARLEIRYRWAAADLSGDGVVNERDDEIRAAFGLWRQERPGEPWIEAGGSRDEEELELHADILGFTRYALASD